jgi:ankyrin repeat protein
MKMLIDNGADLNLPSLDGTTVLMQAVEANKLGQVEFLLKSGALVNLVDERGFSALHRAAEMGHIDIVKILLHYSADKNIKVDSHTALSLAMMNKHKEIVELLKV